LLLSIKEVEIPTIQENEVLIKTTYSSLNYKDALSSVGNPAVTKNFPHITGIDVAGVIEKSNSTKFEVGEKVLVTRYDLVTGNWWRGKYDAVIDTVGGNILAEASKLIKYDGVATCCGLTSSFELNTNVFPFILRGVRLIGIDSVECKKEKKSAAWEKISNEFKIDTLDELTTQIDLNEIKEAFDSLLAGKAVGRYLVKIS